MKERQFNQENCCYNFKNKEIKTEINKTTFVDKLIVRMPINSKPKNKKYSKEFLNKLFPSNKKNENANETKKINNQNIDNEEIVFFNINSGQYKAKFKKNIKYDMELLEERNQYKNEISIFNTLALISFFVIIFSNIFIIFSGYFDFYLIVYDICFGIIIFIFFIVGVSAQEKLDNLMYDFILYDLKRKGMNITYENRATGTISYINNGVRTRISVYRGYNSHANSKYW